MRGRNSGRCAQRVENSFCQKATPLPLRTVRCAKRFETFLRRFNFGEAATFLLDQIIFDAAAMFRRVEKLLPWRDAFAQQNPATLNLFSRPFLARQPPDPARIR